MTRRAAEGCLLHPHGTVNVVDHGGNAGRKLVTESSEGTNGPKLHESLSPPYDMHVPEVPNARAGGAEIASVSVRVAFRCPSRERQPNSGLATENVPLLRQGLSPRRAKRYAA